MKETAMPILTDRLAAITHLSAGAHVPNSGKELCIMEAVSFVTGEPWSDAPSCACPVISALLRAWNDVLEDDERDALLLPLVPLVVNTRGTPALTRRRSIMIVDWFVRVLTPAWLRVMELNTHADALESFSEITDKMQFPALKAAVKAARMDWDVIQRDAGWSDVLDIAWGVVLGGRNADQDANYWYNVLDNIWTSWEVTWDDVRCNPLQTVHDLQKSTLQLVNRMIVEPEPT